MKRASDREHPSAAARAGAAFLLSLFLIGALSVLPGRLAAGPADDITVVLKDKVIRDLSSAGLTLAFHVAVTNKSSSDRTLVRYRYRFTVNQREFLNMSVDLDTPLTVPAGQEILISLPVKITYGLLFDAVGPIEQRAPCDIVGEFVFADARARQQKLAFAYPGEFPIFKDPAIEILPLKVNDLTVGGADVVFRTRFRNPNAFELIIDRISYHLLFGDKEVQAGLISGDKNIPASGDRSFELPFLLDFFEAGKELGDNLRKPAFPCRFEGEIEISSAWGKLFLRFDKAQDIRVEKTS